MAAFSYHYHPFLVDSSSPLFFPNTTTTTTTPSSSSFQEQPHINTSASSADQSSSKVTTTLISYTTESHEYPSPNNKFVTQNQSPETSMVVDGKLELETGEQVTQKVIAPMDSNNNNKRKTTNGSSLNSTSLLSRDSTEGRNRRKQKKSNNIGGVKEEVEKKEKKKGAEEAPTGYIHVRARRGQATDSHSLAERVRREKISERMKVLQRLVPGCDKVTGKALVLDEIINYVQSLQNQVEFLSMKLASLSPLFLDLAMDMDNLFVRPEPDQKFNRIPSSSSSLPQQFSPNLATTPTTMTTTTSFPDTNTANEYLLDYSSSPLFLQGQRSNVFSEYGQFWDVEDQRQKLPHPYGFGNNLCSLN